MGLDRQGSLHGKNLEKVRQILPKLCNVAFTEQLFVCLEEIPKGLCARRMGLGLLAVAGFRNIPRYIKG